MEKEGEGAGSNNTHSALKAVKIAYIHGGKINELYRCIQNVVYRCLL